MPFKKHLRSVSSAAEVLLKGHEKGHIIKGLIIKGLIIMRKSWQVFHDRSLFLRSLWSFVLPVLEYCSAVWCSDADDSHLKLLAIVVRSAGFLPGGILECNLAHRRSVAELYMLFKIKSIPMHSLSCALPLPYMCGACYTWCCGCSLALVRASSL